MFQLNAVSPKIEASLSMKFPRHFPEQLMAGHKESLHFILDLFLGRGCLTDSSTTEVTM